MQIETKFYETIEVEKEQIWQFPKGLPGFEEEKEFALLPIEENLFFQVLQSMKTPEIAFIVGNPYTFTEDYSFTIDEPTKELLKIEQPADVFVLGILSLKEPIESSTINLQAPVVFHTKSKTAKQMILNDTTFSMRHLIGDQVAATEGKA